MEPRAIVLLRGVAGTAALVTLVAGLPAALVLSVGWPLPTHVPELSEITDAIVRGHVDTWTIIKALSVVAWLAWANLAAQIVDELVAWARGLRGRGIPGPSSFRMLAAHLVATAALLVTSFSRPATALEEAAPALAVAETGVVDSAVGSSALASPLVSTSEASIADRGLVPDLRRPSGDDLPAWIVRPRDTLWGVAEQALGDGLRWREIHALNVDRLQPDGGALRAGDEHIRSGWRLLLPHDAQGDGSPPDEATRSVSHADGTVTVQPGDTLWGLARDHLGDPCRWPEVYEANQGRSQPDGRRLTDPDLIHPGWELDLPADEVDGTNRAASASSHLDDHPDQVTGGALDAAPDEPAREPGERVRASGHERRPEVQAGDASDLERSPPDADSTEEEDAATFESFAVVGFGVAAAGIALTLDRIRRAHLRRRRPGQRLWLPDGELATAEQRVRGLADADSTDHLLRALSSLTEWFEEEPGSRPRIVLASSTATEIGVHLNRPAPDAPPGWDHQDGGRTWRLPRVAAAALPDPTRLPGPLVSVGTTADHRRRVLLNLRQAGVLGIEGEPEHVARTLLGWAIELATVTIAAPWRVVLAGCGDGLDGLERIDVVDDASQLLTRLENDVDNLGPMPTDGDDGEGTTLGLFGELPDEPLLTRLHELVEEARGRVSAIVPTGDARTTLSVTPQTWRLDPHGVELHPLELTADELERIGELLVTAKEPAYREASPEAQADISASTQKASHAERAPAVDSTDERAIEVRILGPVQVAGVEKFPTAKSEELVLYLATHRGGADADTLMEVLWPGQEPKAHRLQNEASRARRALGEAPDGTLHLPPADNNRYRLEGVAVDYESFRSLVAQASEDPEHAPKLLREALELVRGRPFDVTGREFPWATYQAHAAEQAVADAAHALAELLLERDDPVGATWAARRGLDAHPLSEVLHRDLMRAADATGNASEVHRIMAELRERIDEDSSGNDADDWLHPETLELFEQLTRQRRVPVD